MLLHRFPFIAERPAMQVLRVTVALVFVLHAAVRIDKGTIPQFAAFLHSRGWPLSLVLVWLLTFFEIVGGLLLAAGYFVKPLAGGFLIILLIGILLIHARQGWFVGEHGTGGSEYSIILMAALLVLAANDNSQRRRTKQSVS